MKPRISLIAAIAILLSTLSRAAELQVHRDVPYAASQNARQTLDVYTTADAKSRPLLVWIHGGGWRMGNKSAVQRKPQAFVDRGYVFVSINYRLVPEVTLKEMMSDVAKAIRYVHEHAAKYGGDPEKMVIMGHSAGAHLAALVATDERYLKAEGLSLANLKGCVPVDTAAYDIAKRTADLPASAQTAKAVFGATEAEQREVSPATHVAKGKHIPPFLILHVADRAESKSQSHLLAGLLTDAGVKAKVVAAEGKTHGTINTALGTPGDKPTQALFEFLDEVLK